MGEQRSRGSLNEGEGNKHSPPKRGAMFPQGRGSKPLRPSEGTSEGIGVRATVAVGEWAQFVEQQTVPLDFKLREGEERRWMKNYAIPLLTDERHQRNQKEPLSTKNEKRANQKARAKRAIEIVVAPPRIYTWEIIHLILSIKPIQYKQYKRIQTHVRGGR